MLTVPVASDDSPTSDTPALIVSNAPAAPPESAEARIALRQHREATALNRFTLPGNILEGTGDLVDHWIVMFCPGWHDKCQGLLPSYELLGVQWENKLNKAVMSSSVRFAKVDCATEKALCVSLDIDDYPSVVHYRNQQRVASWHGGAPGLVRFVKQELEGPKRRPRSKVAVAPAKTSACAELGSATSGGRAEDDRPWPVLRAVCLVLILLAAARCIWVLTSTRVFGSWNARTSHVPSLSSKGATNPISSSDAPGCRRRPLSKEQHCEDSRASLQACLPREWARDRSAIVL